MFVWLSRMFSNVLFALEWVIELIWLYGRMDIKIWISMSVDYFWRHAYQSVVYDTERNTYPQNERLYKMKENWPQYSSIALGINNSRDDHYISKGIPVHIWFGFSLQDHMHHAVRWLQYIFIQKFLATSNKHSCYDEARCGTTEQTYCELQVQYQFWSTKHTQS